jgi:EmrB/QacA subfamily drug resistance transporter
MTAVTTRPAPAGSGSSAQAPHSAEPMTHKQILEALTGLLAALFTALISATIVSNALPTIIGDLKGTQSQYTWVITASLLATTVSTPIWGKLSDQFSKKRLVQLSILVFVVGSMAAGLSQNVPQLIAFRVVQGLGMGGLTALVQSIIGAMIPPRERGRYSGYTGAVMAIATVSGPLVGGAIVDTSWLGWRWCFYVCVPLAVVALAILAKTLHIETETRKVKVDYVGATLIAAAFSALLIWISFAGNNFAWISWQSGAFVGGFLVALVVTVAVELKVPEPIIPLHTLANRTTVLAILGSLAVGVVLYGGTVFLGQYFQLARGYSPTRAGLLTFPLMVGLLISSTVSGQLVSRLGRWKGFLVLGSVLLTVGLVLLGTIDHATSLVRLGLSMAVLGAGVGMLMQNLVLAVQNTVDVREIGAASATVAFFRSLGGAVGVSALGAVLASRVADLTAQGLAAQGPAAVAAARSAGGNGTLDLAAMPEGLRTIVRSSYGDATGRIFLIAAVISVLTLAAVLFIKEVPLRTTIGKVDRPTDLAEPLRSTELLQTAEPVEPDPVGSAGARTERRAERAAAHSEPAEVAELGAVEAFEVLVAARREARGSTAEVEAMRQQGASAARAFAQEVAAAAQHLTAQVDELAAALDQRPHGRHAAEPLDADREAAEMVDALRRYELGLLADAERTAQAALTHARTTADALVGEARSEVQRLEERLSDLRAAEVVARERLQLALSGAVSSGSGAGAHGTGTVGAEG